MDHMLIYNVMLIVSLFGFRHLSGVEVCVDCFPCRLPSPLRFACLCTLAWPVSPPTASAAAECHPTLFQSTVNAEQSQHSSPWTSMTPELGCVWPSKGLSLLQRAPPIRVGQLNSYSCSHFCHYARHFSLVIRRKLLCSVPASGTGHREGMTRQQTDRQSKALCRHVE